MDNPLSAFLRQQGVVILDGALATELETRGFDIDDDLWSARVLLDEPDAIRALHRDYFAAGADCVVTSTYQASIPGFLKKGLGRREAERMLELSVQLALEARDIFWGEAARRRGRLRPLVAASIGPYGAYLADGSEYTGVYDLDAAGLAEFHRERLELLAGCGADLLACETLPSRTEALVLAELLEDLHAPPAWVSFSCRDDRRLWDGSEAAAVAAEVATSSQVVAVGVNCTAPRHIGGLVARLLARTGKPIVAYPNSGEGYSPVGRCWTEGGEELELADAAPRWVELGARLLGGCCRTTPEDIRRLRAVLVD